MATFFKDLRGFCCLAMASLGLLAGVPASAQQDSGVFSYRWNSAPTAEAIAPRDIRHALMWTGHFNAFVRGDLNAAVRKATQAWQKSKGHAPTETLPNEQMVELVSQGLKERDEVGWSILHDSAVGFAIGVPTKFVTFGNPRSEGDGLWYYGGGTVSQSIGVQLGYPSCRSMENVYAGLARATYRNRLVDGIVALVRNGDRVSYIRWRCYGSGSIWAEMTAPVETADAHPGLFAAMDSSLVVLRSMPDPTIRPRPKVEDLPLASSGFSDEPQARPNRRPRPTRPRPASTRRARRLRSRSRAATGRICAPTRSSTGRQAPSTRSGLTSDWDRVSRSARTSS